MLSLVHERYGAGSVIDAVATLTPDGSGESRLTHRGETGVAPELVIANECLHRKGGTTLSGHNFVECDPASKLIYHVSGGGVLLRRHVEEGAVVLYRVRGTSGEIVPLDAIVRIPSGPRTSAHAAGVPRRSRVDGIAPLGRYRTFPGARMQLYSNPLMLIGVEN